MKTIHTPTLRRVRAAKFAAFIAVAAVLGLIATYSNAEPGTPTTTQAKFDPQTAQQPIPTVSNVGEILQPSIVEQDAATALLNERTHLSDLFYQKVKAATLEELTTMQPRDPKMRVVVLNTIKQYMPMTDTAKLTSLITAEISTDAKWFVVNEIVKRGEKVETPILVNAYISLGTDAAKIPSLGQLISARHDELTPTMILAMYESVTPTSSTTGKS